MEGGSRGGLGVEEIGVRRRVVSGVEGEGDEDGKEGTEGFERRIRLR